jgi:type I restriction enzyme S subunit
MCGVELPVPHIDKQREIVAEYNTILQRIDLNNQLIQKLEETAQAIYKQWFVDFEFPNENGEPYKSNGGNMVFNEDIEMEIPTDWEYIELGKAAIIKAGGDKPKIFSDTQTDKCKIPIYSNSSSNEGLFGYTNKATVFDKSITISARGAIIGYTELRVKPFVPIVRLIVVTPKNDYQTNYLYDTIEKFKYDNAGSAQGQLTIPEISSFKVIIPTEGVLRIYQRIASTTFDYSYNLKRENQKLEQLKFLLLSKLATVTN